MAGREPEPGHTLRPAREEVTDARVATWLAWTAVAVEAHLAADHWDSLQVAVPEDQGQRVAAVLATAQHREDEYKGAVAELRRQRVAWFTAYERRASAERGQQLLAQEGELPPQ